MTPTERKAFEFFLDGARTELERRAEGAWRDDPGEDGRRSYIDRARRVKEDHNKRVEEKQNKGHKPTERTRGAEPPSRLRQDGTRAGRGYRSSARGENLEGRTATASNVSRGWAGSSSSLLDVDRECICIRHIDTYLTCDRRRFDLF